MRSQQDITCLSINAICWQRCLGIFIIRQIIKAGCFCCLTESRCYGAEPDIINTRRYPIRQVLSGDETISGITQRQRWVSRGGALTHKGLRRETPSICNRRTCSGPGREKPSAPVGSATVIMVISSVSFIPVLMKLSRLVSRKLCPLVLKSGLPFFAGVGLLGIRLRVSESSLLKN